jgi:hypothetical protein
LERQQKNNQNFINEEIKRRWNTINASYNSAQSLSITHLLSKIEKIKICKISIVPVVLYVRDIRLLTVNEEHRLRVFGNRVLRGTSGPMRH